MVTRNDVAKLAKVSPSVVSYVINNSNYVSEEKRKAVLDAIKALNYIPNENAKNLKQNRTNMIAVIRGSQLNDMFNDLLFHFEQLSNAHGYVVSLITVVRDENYYATSDFVDMLIRRRFDAIFIANSSLSEQQINRISDSGIKILLLMTRTYFGLDPKVSLIVPNYKLAVREIITQLIKLGHTRIMMIPNLMYPGSPYTSDNHRFAGYMEAFSEHGLLINPNYFPNHLDTIENLLEFMESLFKPYSPVQPPTAIYSDETIIVASILKRLNTLGYKVPEDVSLVCSSNSTMATITTPTLTAVGFDPKCFAEYSMQMILELLEGKEARVQEIDFDYYPRESVSPPVHQ